MVTSAAVRGNADRARVAFQGAHGAFSDEAVAACFGAEAESVPCREFVDVVRAVEAGTVGFGILPVENSLAGSVTGAYDALAASALEVVAEVALPIRHSIMGVDGSDLANVRKALSHPVALAQCARFFTRHPHIAPTAAYDTAGAAQEVAERADPLRAAIAARAAAVRYGLIILAEDVQDRADNCTRFFAVARPGALPQDGHIPVHASSTVVLAETENRPGALLDLLTPFARRAINLTKLESRPGAEPWTYRFFLELEGSTRAAEVRGAIDEASRRATSFRVLGSFGRRK